MITFVINIFCNINYYIIAQLYLIFQLHSSIIEMSFKANLSFTKKHSNQCSIVQKGKYIIATSIGVTDNGSILSCRMNRNGQRYYYFKTQSELPSIFSIVDIKLKREAFAKIQNYTHYHYEQKKSVCLFQALHLGNNRVISKFLNRLKTNRVQSYVKLNISQSQGYFQRPLPLLKYLTDLFIQKMREAFLQMKKHMRIQRQKSKKQILLDQLQKISSIHNKDSSVNSKQSRLKTNLINVSYTCIKTERSKLSQITDKRANTANKFNNIGKQPQFFDLKDIMQIGKVKQYQFKNVNVKKVSFNRIKTSDNF